MKKIFGILACAFLAATVASSADAIVHKKHKICPPGAGKNCKLSQKICRSGYAFAPGCGGCTTDQSDATCVPDFSECACTKIKTPSKA